ncbi:antibiotic biosynthesis monooxygenase [Thioclava sp. GXIMD4216]|uniref:putative quinol monooxygenase n=1 Tax=Thioclava sp. GXIMD4216 TaxID=3131929 RepID=UPI0030D25AA3
MPVHVSGHLICKNREEAELIRLYLPQHRALTLAEPGCLLFEVEETEDPLVWRVTESFIDRRALEAHQSRLAHSIWGERTRAIKRDYDITRS